MTQTLREDAERAAGALPPLLVAAERLSSAVSLGVHGRRKAGIGESFWQFRRYQSEDAAQNIDWRQSARSQNLYVREREWEAAEAVWLWRDASAGMRYHSSGATTTKADRATVLTLALASLLIRGGERIALIGQDRPPSTGRVALNRLAHALIDSAPGDAALPPEAPVTKNSQAVWFSDFLSPLNDIETAMKRLARAGLSGHLVHIIDPAEQDFPFTGRTRFESIEGTLTALFGRAESVREGYRTRFKAHGEALSALARRMGWSYLAHRTDKSAQAALVALYAHVGGDRKKG